MGDHQIADLPLALQRQELAKQSVSYWYIQGAEGFIQHNQLGRQGQGPGQGHSLTLTAGQLMGKTLQERRLKSHLS